MNLLLTSFFENYGLIVILIVVCAAMMLFYHLKHRIQEKQIEKFQNSLKPGDRVKTYSGFYGEITNITLIKEDREQVKIVTLKYSANAYIEVDVRAIAQLDTREVEDVQEQTLEGKLAELRRKESMAKKGEGEPKPMFRTLNKAKKADGEKKEEEKAEESTAENKEAPAEEKAEKADESKQEEAKKSKGLSVKRSTAEVANKKDDDSKK